MKYIPGTVFVVGVAKSKPSPSILQQRQTINRPAAAGNFKFNNQYILSRIRPVDNMFEYHFTNQTTGEGFVESFSSTIAADNMIDRFMGA